MPMEVRIPGGSIVSMIVAPMPKFSLVPPSPLGLKPEGLPWQLGAAIEVIVASAVVAEAGETWIYADWLQALNVKPATEIVPAPFAAMTSCPSCTYQVPTKLVRLAKVVVVTGTVVVTAIVVVVMVGALVVVVALLLVELWVASEVIPTAASATTATIATIIQPVRRDSFFSASLEPSATVVSLCLCGHRSP